MATTALARRGASPLLKLSDEDLKARALAVLRSAVPNFEPDFFQSMGLKLGNDPFDKPYAQHPWVYVCNRLKAETISQVPFRIYQEGNARIGESERMTALRRELPKAAPDALEMIAALPTARQRMREIRRAAPWLPPRAVMRATSNAQPVEAGPWYELFRRPNPLLTRAQLWEASFINLNTSGECFWRLEGKDETGVRPNEIPTELWPTGRRGWKPIIDKRTKLPRQWEYTTYPDGQKNVEVYEPQELVRWLLYNPYDPLRGLAPTDAMSRELEMDHHAVVFNLAFFKNGAKIGGWVTTERKLTPEQRRDLVNMIEARHQGSQRSHRPAVFEGGVKFTESTQNHRAMQFHDLREWVRDVVFANSRTPKAMLGIGSYDTKATALAETRNFWESNLIPQIVYAEDLLDGDLFTAARTGGGSLWGAFDLSVVVALREDLGEKLDVAKKITDVGYTINQANERLALGMEDVEWGDTWYVPAGYKPVDLVSNPPPPPAGAPPPPPPAPTPDAEEEHARPPARSAGPPVRLATPEHWDALETRLFTPGEAAMEKKVRGFLFALRKEQLDLIEQRGEPHDVDFVLFNLEPWQVEISKRTRPVYERTFLAALDEVEEEIARMGKSVHRALDPEVDAEVEKLARRIRRSVKTIRAQLYDVLAEVIAAGGDQAAAQTAVRAYFNKVATARATVGKISRTAVSSTISSARDLGMKRAAIQRGEWLNAGDELVRDNHVVYGTSGPQTLGFNYATLVGATYLLPRPLAATAPASEVVNCRCVLVPAS